MNVLETRTRAVDVLERMQLGTGTVGEVAVLAAEVLANPPPLMAAAQRYLRAIGTEHEGASAVAFLELLADASCRERVNLSAADSELGRHRE